ncbi:MAG TPA: trypsin-like peptidase domain-containing protein [Burkholderiales bacterium]|nr:trypsin-like peptidase domain-containing protein [Burkholderiales bacterium]
MLLRTSIGAALLASLALPAAALDGFAVYQQARPNMLQIVGVSPEGRFHMGSGVALPNGTVVTNCHVTLRAKRVQLFWGGGAPSATLEAATVGHDLCALYFPELNRSGAAIGASRELQVGDPVFAIGYNAGHGLTYQPGEVAELYEHDGGMVVRTTAAFTHGASGGGLFDQHGRLVAILTFFRVSKDKTDYFAVPVEWLKDLEGAPATPVAPLEGVPFWADEIGRQPAFLKAGALEADGRWEELATMARNWTETAPSDAHAWMALGKAATQLGDSVVADDAFRRAAELGATYPATMQSR